MNPGRQTHSSDLEVRLGPLRLRHPLINASGTMEILELGEAFGPGILTNPPVSAYVPKTVTLEPRVGNPGPRILETASGMINSIGISSEGMKEYCRKRLPRLLSLPCPLIVSIGGFSREEYVSLSSDLGRALKAHFGSEGWGDRVGLELNISCPNVHSGCASIGADPGETQEVVSAVRETWPGLLIAKLTPNVEDIATIGLAAVAGGADALAAVNTYRGMVIDRNTLRPYLGNVIGGVSGPAVKPLALLAVHQLYSAVDVPIIGMGGVSTVQDVLDFIACGARVVAVGSAAFRDPFVAEALAEGLRGALSVRGLHLDEAVGIAHRKVE